MLPVLDSVAPAVLFPRASEQNFKRAIHTHTTGKEALQHKEKKGGSIAKPTDYPTE